MNSNLNIPEQSLLTVTMKLVKGKEALLDIYKQHDEACSMLFSILDRWRTSDKTNEKKAYAEITEKSDTPQAVKVSYALFDTNTTNKSVKEMKAVQALIKDKVIPLQLYTKDFDFSTSRKGYRRSVIYECLKRYNSWNESNALTQAFIKEKQTEMAEIETKILAVCDKQGIADFIKWYETVSSAASEKESQDSLTSTTKSTLPFIPLRVNQKFLSFWHFQLKNAFAEGKVIYKGRWINKKNERRVYSVPSPESVDLLYKTPSIWPILDCEGLVEYIELYEGFKRWKTTAQLTPPKFLESPTRMELGANLIPIGEVVIDNQRGIMSMNLPRPASKVGEPGDDLKLDWAFGVKGLVQNLKIKYHPEASKYTFEFLHNGKTPIAATVSQFSIKFVPTHSKVDINNLKESDFDVVLYITYKYSVVPPSGLSVQDLNALVWSLRKSYPAVLKRKNQKTIKEKAGEIPAGSVTVNVDLGWNPVATYSVIRTEKTGYTILEQGKMSWTPKHSQLINAYRDVKQLLDATTDYLTFDEKEETIKRDEVFNTALFDRLNSYTDKKTTIGDYIKWIEKMSKVKRSNWHCRDYKWFASEILHDLYNQYKQSQDERKTYNEPESHLHWVMVIEARKSATTAVMNYGYVRSKDHKDTFGYFVEEMERCDNIKDDFCKKISNKLLQIAVKHKAISINVEQFIERRGNRFNDKKENRMFQKWIVGQLKDQIVKDTKKVGVAVIEADERQTSQIYALTGEWLVEDEKDFKIQYTPEGKVIDRDINSTINIYNRVACCHTDLRSLEFVENEKGQFAPACSLSDKAEDKREKGMLTKHYTFYNVVFVKSGNELKANTRIEFKKSLFAGNVIKHKMYVSGNTFDAWSER